MSKELFVSSTPHQTKVALVENDTLSEVYYERENEYTLAGSIYKGRVTRVLPGMQSAFVDIGLERDAFLYVSDFLEMEDEDEAIEPIPVQQQQPVARPFEMKPQEPRPEPPATFRSEQGAPAVFEGGYGEEEQEQSSERGNGQGDGNGRRWRGRRRRRGGGRDRGFPEAKFAHPDNGGAAATEQEVEAPAEEGGEEGRAPKYKPIVLPGESIAKLNRAVETPSSDEEVETEQVEAPAQEPEAPVVQEEREPPRQYKPIVLPGESIAKFNRQAAEGEASEGATVESSDERQDRRQYRYGREDRRGRRDRPRGFEPRHRPAPAEDDAPERSYPPIVLPGESISKYRNIQAAPVEEVPEQPEEPEQTSREVFAPVEEHQQAQPELEMVSPIVREEEIEKTHFNPATEAGAEEEQPKAAAEEQPVAEVEPAEEKQHRFEQRNVASTFGGEETESGEAEEPQAEGGAEAEEVHAESRSAESALDTEPHAMEEQEEETLELPKYHEAPEGAFEEEEFDADEEDDLPHPAESLYEPEDYEELEEETLEPMEQAAKELVEAMAETGAIMELTGGHNGDENGDEEDEEIDEIENAAYAEIGEPEAARAELRGPSATAGFQQRAPRPDFDRNRRDRGRRGGGGRGMGRGAPRREQSRPQVLISEVLKEGQEIMVQIAKEPIGKKGARITSHIALPGRFLVYMPSVNHVGVSRKISSDEERLRLKRIVQSERENGHGGFIVRTAAAGISEEDLRNDIRFLKSLWHDIKTRSESSKSPALIYHDLNLVERTMRDLVTNDFTAIWADTEQEYERINRFVSRFQPGLIRRVKLYTKEVPLFEQFGIDAEINKALKSKVWLKSGGYIVINQTEALVAIDINTGKYVGKTQRLEDTIFKTNVDAIKEIVRQIRLRDLGGIIVIDFIDMDERKNRQKVMQALEEEMKSDRAPSKVLQFNDFGLVAITRKRVKQSLERTLGTPCPYCTGNGYVKSPATVCNEIYVEMRKMRKQFESDILLRVNPEVAKALKANNGRWLMEMEELTGKNILVKSDPILHQEQFDM